MKLVHKYTDEYYANELEIKQDFLIGSPIIIEEIRIYRNQYKIYFYYENIKYSLVYLPKIKEILNIYYSFDQKDILHPFIQIFILRNKINLCKQCVLNYKLPIELLTTFDYVYSFEEDMTKSFLEWLMHITTFSFMKVLRYDYKKVLSTKQRSFLLKESYFSICDYQKEMNLSYETSRLHLNYLVKCKLISRHKVGKRYLFKVIYV